MRVLIIDQCSGAKTYPDWFEPFNVKAVDSHTREELLSRDRVPSLRARDLYAGRQQRYVSEAVESFRAAGDEVTRLFISAGFGLVDEYDDLPPYEVTFKDFPRDELHKRSRQLRIQADLEGVLNSAEYDIAFFALGSDYYRSLDLEALLNGIPTSTAVVLFNQEEAASRHSNAVSLPARTENAKEQGTIVVALKGKYIQNFAEHRSNGVSIEDAENAAVLCKTDFTKQTGLNQFETD